MPILEIIYNKKKITDNEIRLIICEIADILKIPPEYVWFVQHSSLSYHISNGQISHLESPIIFLNNKFKHPTDKIKLCLELIIKRISSFLNVPENLIFCASRRVPDDEAVSPSLTITEIKNEFCKNTFSKTE